MITVSWTDYLDHAQFGPEHDEPLYDLALTREGRRAVEMCEALAAEQVEDFGVVSDLPCDHTVRDVVFDDLPVNDEDQVVVCVACGAEHGVEGWVA